MEIKNLFLKVLMILSLFSLVACVSAEKQRKEVITRSKLFCEDLQKEIFGEQKQINKKALYQCTMKRTSHSDHIDRIEWTALAFSLQWSLFNLADTLASIPIK